MENNNKETFNSFNLILFIWKWRKPLLIISLAAAILAFIFSSSWIIPPRYDSSAIIYAPRTNSLSKILTNEQNYNEKLEIKAYGVEEETEQLLQILSSRAIMDSLIRKFDLIPYYGIDTTKKHWKSKLYNTVSKCCSFRRTEFGAITVKVTDWNPNRASDMTNYIVEQLDSAKNRVERERSTASYLALKKQLVEIEKELTLVDDSLTKVMEHGIYDYESQSERVTQQYALAVAQGNNAAIERLRKELEKISTWGPIYIGLRDLQFNFRKYYAICKGRMLDAKMDMESMVPVKFVVEKATPADKKAYPKRLTIMIISAIATFVFSIVVLLILETLKKAPDFSRRKNSKQNKEQITE